MVDSADILLDAAGTLAALCGALGIASDAAMLRWAPGIRDTDGVWASHWYDAVTASEGFGPPDGPAQALDAEAQRVADQCRPAYEQLAAHKSWR